MSEKDEHDINLRTLKRVDSKIEKIKGSATQVAIYDFCPVTKNWNKMDIEGSLFVVRRNDTATRYSLLVINRLSTVNMIEPITSNIHLSIQEPFVLYKNGHSKIYCIWFYDAKECQRIANLLHELIKRATSQEKMNNVKNKLEEIGLNVNDKHIQTVKILNTPEPVKPDKCKILTILQNSHNRSLAMSPDNFNHTTPTAPIPVTPKSHHYANGKLSVSVNELFNHCNNNKATAFSTPLPFHKSSNIEHSSIGVNNFFNQSPITSAPSEKDLNDILTPQSLAEQQTLVKKDVNETEDRHVQPPQSSSIITQLTNSFNQAKLGVKSPPNLEQFKNTLVHLIENDRQFLNTIHTAYLKLYHNQ